MGKESGGSQTTNTIQKADPWGPIQPYLLEGAQAASNLYNATPGGTQPYPGQQMALLPDWMRNNILSGINSASSAAPYAQTAMWNALAPGLPLAIELAAAQMEDLAPEQILAGLGDRLKLLKGDLRHLPPRQQTLRGAIDWSYHLLALGERTLLRRLGVFVGGCSLAAVQAVCNASQDLPFEAQEGITALSSKSLLYREAGVEGEPRWGMLESIREYARERLEASGEATKIHRLHAEYCVRWPKRQRQSAKARRELPGWRA